MSMATGAREPQPLASGAELLQRLERGRVLRVPLQQQLQHLDGVVPAPGLIDARQRYVGGLELRGGGDQPLQHERRASGVRLRREHEREIVARIAVARVGLDAFLKARPACSRSPPWP